MVLGAGGQLGGAVVEKLSSETTVHGYRRAELDVSDATAVRSRVEQLRPAVVINCSAFTDVDGAEDRPVEALRVNGVAVGVLARATAGIGATFVHYSTDFVFAGHEDRAWQESDLPEPQGVFPRYVEPEADDGAPKPEAKTKEKAPKQKAAKKDQQNPKS